MTAHDAAVSAELEALDRFGELLSSARDVSKVLIAELEFTLEVVREGLPIDRELPRLIASWNDYVTRLNAGVYRDGDAPEGGLDQLAVVLDEQRAAELSRVTDRAALKEAQKELAYLEGSPSGLVPHLSSLLEQKRQAIADLTKRLGPETILSTAATVETKPQVSTERVKQGETAKPACVSAATAGTQGAGPARPLVSSRRAVADQSSPHVDRNVCGVCTSRNRVQTFQDGPRCAVCLPDAKTVRHARDTLTFHGVRPLEQRGVGESRALTMIRDEGQEALSRLDSRERQARNRTLQSAPQQARRPQRRQVPSATRRSSEAQQFPAFRSRSAAKGESPVQLQAPPSEPKDFTSAKQSLQEKWNER